LPLDHASDEHECDVAAINNLRSAKLPLDLGAFQTILVRSIQEGREDLWGVTKSGIELSLFSIVFQLAAVLSWITAAVPAT
jgi:hypothetical protein